MWSFYIVGAIAVNDSIFGEATSGTVVYGVNCTGSETTIMDCPHNTGDLSQCNADAGVFCQGKIQHTFNCM